MVCKALLVAICLMIYSLLVLVQCQDITGHKCQATHSQENDILTKLRQLQLWFSDYQENALENERLIYQIQMDLEACRNESLANLKKPEMGLDTVLPTGEFVFSKKYLIKFIRKKFFVLCICNSHCKLYNTAYISHRRSVRVTLYRLPVYVIGV